MACGLMFTWVSCLECARLVSDWRSFFGKDCNKRNSPAKKDVEKKELLFWKDCNKRIGLNWKRIKISAEKDCQKKRDSSTKEIDVCKKNC